MVEIGRHDPREKGPSPRTPRGVEIMAEIAVFTPAADEEDRRRKPDYKARNRQLICYFRLPLSYSWKTVGNEGERSYHRNVCCRFNTTPLWQITIRYCCRIWPRNRLLGCGCGYGVP